MSETKLLQCPVLQTNSQRLPSLRFLMPRSLDEALAMLQEDTNAKPVAGGTFLIPSLISHQTRTTTLVDLTGVEGYRYVKSENGFLKVGGFTTIATLVESDPLNAFDAFRTFKNGFVSPPIMNIATVGGSLALRSYTEDLVTIFLSLNAQLVMINKGVERVVSLSDHVDHSEDSGIIKEIEFIEPKKNLVCFFSKLNMSVSRIPFASLALKAELDGNIFSEVNIVANCARGSTPGRLSKTEAALTNTRFEADSVSEAINELEQEAEPHSDFMAPGWYRKKGLGALLRKISLQARQKGGFTE